MRKSLKMALATGATFSALALAPQAASALELGACIDSNKLDNVLAQEGQRKVFKVMDVGKTVSYFTSNDKDKTAYFIKDDNCDPDAPNEASTGEITTGLRVDIAFTDVTYYDYTKSGIPPSALKNFDWQVAHDACEALVNNPNKKTSACGVHGDYIQKLQQNPHLNVAMSAYGHTKTSRPLLSTLFVNPDKNNGAILITNELGVAVPGGTFIYMIPVH